MNRILKVLIVFLIVWSSSNAQCSIEDYEVHFCDNESSIDLSLSEPNANGTYAYFENGMPIADPTNFILGGSTDLAVVFTESGTNCTSGFTLSLIEQISPEIIVFGESVLDCLILSLQFPIRIEPEGDYEYVWSGPGISNPNLESPTVELPGLYKVEVTDPITGCSTSTELIVTQNLVIPEVKLDTILNCDNTAFLVAQPINALSNYNYSWSGPGLISNPDSSTVLVNQEGIYSLVVEDAIHFCSILEEKTIESLDCLIDFSESPELRKAIKIYPNPVSDFLSLELEDRSIEVFLFNATGGFVKALAIEGGSLDFSSYPSGIYFLVFKKGQEWSRQKIIKI